MESKYNECKKKLIICKATDKVKLLGWIYVSSSNSEPHTCVCDFLVVLPLRLSKKTVMKGKYLLVLS